MDVSLVNLDDLVEVLEHLLDAVKVVLELDDLTLEESDSVLDDSDRELEESKYLCDGRSFGNGGVSDEYDETLPEASALEASVTAGSGPGSVVIDNVRCRPALGGRMPASGVLTPPIGVLVAGDMDRGLGLGGRVCHPEAPSLLLLYEG